MNVPPALCLSHLAKSWCNPATILCLVLDPNLLPSILPSLPQHLLLSWIPSFSVPQPHQYLHIPPLVLHSSSPSYPAPCPFLWTACWNPHKPQQNQGGNSASSLLGHDTLQSWEQRRRWECSAGVGRQDFAHL